VFQRKRRDVTEEKMRRVGFQNEKSEVLQKKQVGCCERNRWGVTKEIGGVLQRNSWGVTKEIEGLLQRK
jgi:hypothetical protein